MDFSFVTLELKRKNSNIQIARKKAVKAKHPSVGKQCFPKFKDSKIDLGTEWAFKKYQNE